MLALLFCVSAVAVMPSHAAYMTYAIDTDTGNSSSSAQNEAEKKKKEKEDADKKAKDGDLSGVNGDAEKNVKSGINKVKTAIETIAKAAGAILLAYAIIKYQMSLIDENPMSKLDAATKIGAAIALISLPSIANDLSDKIADGKATTGEFFTTAQSTIGTIAMIIGAVLVVTGIWLLIVSVSQENSASYYTALKIIGLGALLMGAKVVLTNLNLEKYIDGSKKAKKAAKATMYIITARRRF